MRNFMRDLEAAFWRFLKPEFDMPDDFDEVSQAAHRQYVTGLKHPAACAGGCQCDLGGGDTS